MIIQTNHTIKDRGTVIEFIEVRDELKRLIERRITKVFYIKNYNFIPACFRIESTSLLSKGVNKEQVS